MALLTPMTLDQAQRLGLDYGLQVRSLEVVAKGINSNFLWQLGGAERVFVRVHEQTSPMDVRAQCRLLDHLARAGVPTPAPLERRDGAGPVGMHHGKPLVVFPYRAGDWCCQATVDQAKAARVGQVLARIHQAGASFRDPPAERMGPAQLDARLAALGHLSLPPALQRDVERAADELGRLVRSGALGTEPVTVVHGDLFRDNVLWHRGQLSAVLDFEYAAAGAPAFDLMVTVLAWCYGDRFEGDLIRALCAGYQSERALGGAELASCHGWARFVALRFAISRVEDYELRPREAIVYKDYRRYLARLEALDGLGSAEWRLWLG